MKLINKLLLLKKKVSLKIKEGITIIPDFLAFILRSKGHNSQVDRIIFIGSVMHARIGRIAKWIKKENNEIELFLICSESGYSEKLSNNSFDSTFLYRNKWHLRSILEVSKSSNNFIYLFGPPYYAAYTALKNIKSPSIFDFQDLMITNYGLNPPFRYMKKELRLEEYVLKNVDGIINHSLELQTAKKYYGKINASKLFFPNYVDNDFIQKKESKLKDEFSVVYVGSIHSAYRNKDYFGGTQLHWLIETFNSQQIHFHIYPAPTNLKEHLIDYIALNEEYPYFHLHEPIDQNKLPKEINKYDYGILPFFHKTNTKLNDKRYYSTTLKMFNFFEAGIPILIGEDVDFQNYMGRKFGGSIKIKWEQLFNLRKVTSQVDYNSLINQINQNRESLSLKNKINRLINFIDRLQKDKYDK